MSLGKKYVLFCGMRTPARASLHLLHGRRAYQERRRRSTGRDGTLGPVRARRELDVLQWKRVHKRRVER